MLRALPEQRTDEESVEDCGCLDAKGVLGSSCKLHMASFRYWRVFSQQRKLMGSSTQNSSVLHGCRHRVRFNEVPAKVPKVPEKVWEALVQSQVRFNRVLEKVPERVRARSGSTGFRRRFQEALVQSQVRFNGFRRRFRTRPGRLWSREGSGEGLGGFGANRVLEKVPEKVPGGFGAEPAQVQQGSGEGSGAGLGGFGAR